MFLILLFKLDTWFLNVSDLAEANGLAITRPGLPNRPPAQPINPCPRPGIGTAGRRIDLLANFFEMKLNDAHPLFHYKVGFIPQQHSKDVYM